MVHLSIPNKLKPGSRPPSRSSSPKPEQQQPTPPQTLVLQIAIIQVFLMVQITFADAFFRLGAKFMCQG